MTTTLPTAPALVSEPSRAERRAAAPFLPHARISARTALWIFIMGFAMVCPLVVGLSLLHLPQSLMIAEFARARFVNYMMHPAILFAGAVIVAPILEEGFYRGIVMQFLRRYCGQWTAMLVSSAMFAATHLGQGLTNALFAFVVGIFFAWLVVRTKSLYASMLCHAMVNLSWLFLFIPGFGLLEKIVALDPKLPLPAVNPLTDLVPAWWLVFSLGLVIAGWLRRDRMLPRADAAI